LDHSVVSCAEAAVAKGIPLERELKSLLLETEKGLLVAHLRATAALSLRAVKRVCDRTEAHLAIPQRLAQLGLEAGAISPFRPELWDLEHVIDVRLLQIDWVTTNDGTTRGYFIFDPLILLRAAKCSVAAIER
jgi:prolyl-tRNA editing enzyme YbaK/EbsC (Cys-tRNA(Pro) deacylase)